jgi:apolipoprotein N-acyltransferase
MLAGVAGLLVWAGAGWWRLGVPAAAAPGLSVVLVQGNIVQGQKWNRAVVEDLFRRHLALSVQGREAAAAANQPALVVWPETASPYLLDTDANARAAIAEAAGSREPGGRPALVGSVRFDDQNRPRNSLMAIDGAGPPLAMYDKWHLVPFGEYQPSWMPLPIQVVPGGGFGFGDGPQTLHLPGLPAVGPLICYETIFPGQAVLESDRPAWMVNVTNDAWFGNSTGPRQHLAAARTRAVEEGLPLLRAANTGITAGFDAHGHELGRLPMGTPGVLVLNLPGPLPATLFARFGLLIPGVLALLAFASGFLPRGKAGPAASHR